RVSFSSTGSASCPAKVTGSSYWLTQSCSRVRTPDRPASAPSQVEAASPPSGFVVPRPVTTTFVWSVMRVSKDVSGAKHRARTHIGARARRRRGFPAPGGPSREGARCTRAGPGSGLCLGDVLDGVTNGGEVLQDRKSTRLNSSHASISYAVF